MGRFIGRVAVLFALLLPGSAVQAQQPLSIAPPCVCQPLPPTPVAPVAPLPCCPPAWRDNEERFAIELMLGQETGVRGQFAVYRGNQEALVVEGFFGGLFHHLGSSEALGVGGRYLVQSGWSDGVNSILLGPGLDIFFQTNHNGLILLAPSVDLAWLYRLGPNLEWEIGLDAGLGVGVGGHTNHGNSAAGDVTPLISVYTGLRF
jgi:hypothetical protein